jgi:hypothetical protein
MLAIGSIAGMAVGSRAQAETEYTPSVSLSQRYSSNVFYSAKQNLPPGTQLWDLISTLGADVKILNKSRMGDSEVSAGVNGNAYAYNSNLSYASTNVFARSDVSNWANELLPGLQLRISDAFRYTPQPPAFLTGGTPQQTDVFARGLQARQANSFSNSLSTDGDYSFSRSVGLRANYTYSIMRFGRIYVTQSTTPVPVTFFDTTIHNAAIGPTYTFYGGDTLFLKFNYMSSEQTISLGSRPPIKFTSQSIQPEYVTTIVHGLTATISAGATMVEQQAGNRIFASGKFTLTNEFDRQTRVSIAVSRQTAPSFVGTGGAVISNVYQLYGSHDFSELVRLTVSGNYAHNESTKVKTFTIETINASAVLDYNLTRSTKLSLSQQYANFNITGIPTYDMLVTMLAVNIEWK